MRKLSHILGLAVVLGLLLAACGPKTPLATQLPSQPPTATATAVPPTPTPTPPPPQGSWVDSIVFSSIDSPDVAITQLKAGQLDVFAETVSNPENFKVVKEDANLRYYTSLGTYTELTFNPILNFKDGRLNPFGDPQIREAMNMLVDRNYIVQEIYGGLAVPKLLPLNSSFPDYARYIDTARALENIYAYNPDKAKAMIKERMEALGATMGADGKWQYNGQPVTLIFIIRIEDERKAIGDYVAGVLEDAGFTVDRQYKSRQEASPIWLRSDPNEGQWNLYTGGWITTAISRDDGSNFAYYYTKLGGGSPLWQAYTPSDEFYSVAEKLWNNDFTTLDERGQLFQKAMELALKDSVRVWLVDQVSFSPARANVQLASDLAGGISGSRLWPYTLQFTDKKGGEVRIAVNGIPVDPWNPIAGSNWISDQMAIRATGDVAAMPDPYTGLAWPQRIEKAEVVAKEGLPISKSLDWVDLKFEPEIKVPADAWADWDAANQKFITVGEKFPEGTTALVKTTVVYPKDLFQKIKWHDGSPLTLGDFIMGMILTFDPGKQESAIYDEAAASNLESFLSHFKGVRIVSTDPLTIETYDDYYLLDAELTVSTWWPAYGYGQAPWHSLALAIQAEADKKLAFSTDKAQANGVEWTSFIGGPSLEILKGYLDQDAQNGYVPYAETLGKYVTADEAKARYANLQKWYQEHGHFWVGTGPFYLDKVFTTEKSLVLKRYADFPDYADKWLRFGEPKIAAVTLDGPAQVKAGEEAKFNVSVTFKGQPYPANELASVKYLLFDANNNLVAKGDAVKVAEGQYQVVLGADMTKGLTAGTNKLEVVVASNVVSIPSFQSIQFVTVP
uniref:Peptide/nickel transport system substrate-binding protein n=1 Tax=uncultured Chloroflexota bacterium TaxID=166587 RepID=H5SET0_9CHLR|nr:peptide/nickel transport system substrate-binding protein [uncultured Chloroflexota bacterium]BAL56879.1 peptide/nickel transport system substrate-binding protein [uncultured Chloroflexota bacterium]